MDIRTGLEGLKSLLGVAPAATPATQQPRTGSTTVNSALGSDRATLSSAGSEVSLTGSEAEVRTEKVANIQAALASGNYNVPASAIASKVVDAMLGEGR